MKEPEIPGIIIAIAAIASPTNIMIALYNENPGVICVSGFSDLNITINIITLLRLKKHRIFNNRLFTIQAKNWKNIIIKKCNTKKIKFTYKEKKEYKTFKSFLKDLEDEYISSFVTTVLDATYNLDKLYIDIDEHTFYIKEVE